MILVNTIYKRNGFNLHGLNNRQTIGAKFDPLTKKVGPEVFLTSMLFLVFSAYNAISLESYLKLFCLQKAKFDNNFVTHRTKDSFSDK